MPDATGCLIVLSFLCLAPLAGVVYVWRVRSNGGIEIKKITTQRRRYCVLGLCLLLTSLMTTALYLLASPATVVATSYALLGRGIVERWAAVHGLMLLWGAWEATIMVVAVYVRLRPAPMARRAKTNDRAFVTTASLRQKQPITVRPEVCMAAIADEPELSRRMIFTETGSGTAYWYDRRGHQHQVTRTVK